MSIERCDLCESEHLEPVYRVPNTRRDLTVHVCRSCGLAQSLPRIDHVPRRSAFPDSGASFGNIRYGKGFRTAFALDLIAKHKSLDKFSHCLDVGSNRGSFLIELKKQAPKIHAMAIEPDHRVVSAYEQHDGIELVLDRVENVSLPEGSFDLIYHCHTLEHQAHPLRSLIDLRQSMTDDGLLFLEVPNIALLKSRDLIEEWFIDKHLYHYSASTLIDLVQKAGYAIVERPNEEDDTNISLLLKKNDSSVHPSICSDEFEQNRSLIGSYAEQLLRNQQKLETGAKKLSAYSRGRSVAIWGAGRIYTSIVDIGKFNPRELCCVVDKHLHKYVPEMFGVSVEEPSVLASKKPDVVLVASRLYLEEIKLELQDIIGDVEVLTLDDVLDGNIAA
jgi:SAM-dependent methyltransferase